MPQQNFEKTIKQLREDDQELTYLHLPDMLSSGEMDELARALMGNTTLELLDFGENEIGDEGAKAIAKSLEHNKNITTLNLRANNISDEGAKAIANALLVNTTLESLDIEANNIGDEGAKAIASALEKNTSLNWLGITDNNLGPEGVKLIAKALEKNMSLKFLKIDNNESEIGDEGGEAIARALDKNRIPRDIVTNRVDMSPITADIHRKLHRNDTLHPAVVGFFKAPPGDSYFSMLPLNVRDMLPDHIVSAQEFSQLHRSQADVEIMDSMSSSPRPTYMLNLR